MNRIHRWRTCSIVALICLLPGFTSWAAADKKPDPKQAEVLPAKLSGFSDSGKFDFYIKEEVLIKSTFHWKEDGSFESKNILEVAGQKLTWETIITTDKQGYWTKIEGNSRDGKFNLVREGDKVKRTLNNKTLTLPLKAGVVLFENF